MPQPRPDPVGYLAACYRADNRAGTVFNLLGKDVQHRHVATGTEVLLTGLQDAMAVPTEKGLAALKAAATYKRERSLIYGTFFVVGTMRDGQKLCAPIVYFPATLSTSDQAVRLTIDTDEQTINFSLFERLLGDEHDTSDVLETILDRVPRPPFDELTLSELMQIFRDFFPETDVDAMYAYPKLTGERAVRAAQKESSLTCLPVGMMALVPNPRAARGVLFELATEALRNEWSTPTRALFGATHDEELRRSSPSASATVPAVLSAAQQKILASARRHPLTLTIGPPGTGKSYTLAAVAVDHVLRGEAVLIACRTENALDVVESKLEAVLGDTTAILRGGSHDTQRQLKRYLKRLLSGQHETPAGPTPEQLARQLLKKMAAIADDEMRLEKRTQLEHAMGALEAKRDRLGLFDRLRHRLIDWRLERAGPHWELHERLEAHQTARIELATKLLSASRAARIARVLDRHRPELKRFLDALRARTSSRQERLFDETELGTILAAFPLWMSTFKDLHRLVPSTRELFDLVIIDEATQSDMASPLPALFRAKRAVVTGDPEQLRHVSFLARDRQAMLADEHGLDEMSRNELDYREKSLLDLVDGALGSQKQVGFLNEHFRSMPQIIEFSNREFYGGELQIMTSRPETLRERAVVIRNVGGVRAKSGANHAEADALVDELVRRVNQERELDRKHCHSIGVLSPFRDQVDVLSKKIFAALDVDAIEKHAISIGTAYGFQGEERDIMLLSFALDATSHPASFRYMSRSDVFNVTITRARDLQIVFTSFAAGDVGADSLLARYLAAMSREPRAPRRSTVHDELLRDVSERLVADGFHLWPTFAVAGSTVDLLAEKDGRAFGIDLIGCPGELGEAVDLERFRMLARAGLSLFPLPYSAWKRDPDRCLDAARRHWVAVARASTHH